MQFIVSFERNAILTPKRSLRLLSHLFTYIQTHSRCSSTFVTRVSIQYISSRRLILLLECFRTPSSLCEKITMTYDLSKYIGERFM